MSKDDLRFLGVMITMVGFLIAAALIVHYGTVKASAQSAKVVKLNDLDASQGRALWDAQLKAQTAFTEYSKLISERYLKDKEGFDGGFEFSEDFNYLVPTQSGGSTIYVMRPAPDAATWPDRLRTQ